MAEQGCPGDLMSKHDFTNTCNNNIVFRKFTVSDTCKIYDSTSYMKLIITHQTDCEKCGHIKTKNALSQTQII